MHSDRERIIRLAEFWMSELVAEVDSLNDKLAYRALGKLQEQLDLLTDSLGGSDAT